MTKEDLQLISEMLDEKLNKAFDEKLNKTLDEKLNKAFDEKLNKILDEKLNKAFDERLAPINEKLDKMQEDVEIIKEDACEVRTTVEEICKWIDLNFDHKYPFPIDKNIGVV